MAFARSGSVLCIAGALVVIRGLFIEGFTAFARVQGLGGFSSYVVTPERKKEAFVTIGGIVVVGVGTLIWAYGDLLLR